MKLNKIQIVLSIALFVAIAGSYIVNKLAKDSSPLKIETSPKENVDEYNKRKKDEVQARVKEQKKLRDAEKQNSVASVILTIDGWDPATKKIIDPINLWRNYETRSYAGKVRHGDKVTFIKRNGDGVLIETKYGVRGWITYFFIKDFKDEETP